MPRSSASAPIRAGLLAVHGIITEPVLALVVAGLAAMVLGFVTSFLVIRGVDLTRLMVTLGIALLLRSARRTASPTSPAAPTGCRASRWRRSSACSRSTCSARPASSTASRCCSCCSCWRGGSCIRRSACRCARSATIRCAASAIGIPVNRRLIAIYTLAAFYAGIAGALFTQTTALASLDVFSFERSADLMLVLVIGGTGYLYGGLIGAVVFKLLQELFSTHHAAILAVLDRPGAGGDRADRPRADAALGAVAAEPRDRGMFARGARPIVAVPKATRHDDRAGNHRAGKAFRRARGHPRSVAVGSSRAPATR